MVKIQTETIEKTNKNLVEKKEELIDTEKAIIVLQETAKRIQEQLKFRLEDIINSAIDGLFPGQYRFALEFVNLRGQTEVKPVLYSGEDALEDITETNGGGLADIIGFALRVSFLLISKNQKVLILDEPFKFVSEEYREAACLIVKKLSKELGIQVIMVTHDKAMIDIADKVFTVKKIDGRSVVK
jgi:DNA repair ATPase RecN